MKVIGLTGGIGTGKSTVSRFLAELGALVISADVVGHEAYQPGTEGWRVVVEAFGEQILTPAGDIDRKKLGEIVFQDGAARATLNSIMHPRMYEMVSARIEDRRQQGAKVVVLESPLLVEAGWLPLVDEVWVTIASEANIVQRLKNRSGLSEAETMARIRSQLSSEERLKYADVVINTDVTLEEMKERVAELWRRLALDT